jgi:hypothetical protein
MAIPTEVLLIDDVYLKSQTEVNDSVDQTFIFPVIVSTQDTYLEYVLGTRLFNKLREDYGNGTISGNYVTLHDQYIRKCLLWAVMVELYPRLTYKVDNSSLVQRTSEDTATIDDQRLKDTISRAIKLRNDYERKLINYLCANSSFFPEYTSNVFPEICPKRVQGFSNLVFSDGNTAMSNPSRNGMDIEQFRRMVR